MQRPNHYIDIHPNDIPSITAQELLYAVNEAEEYGLEYDITLITLKRAYVTVKYLQEENLRKDKRLSDYSWSTDTTQWGA